MTDPVQTSPQVRGEAALVFRVGAFRMLIASAEVAEARELHVPEGAANAIPPEVLVRGGTQRVPVLSAGEIFGVASCPRRLLLMAHRGVALVVDGTESVVEIHELVALPRAFAGDERRWYRGLALLDGAIVPVVDGAFFAEVAAEQKNGMPAAPPAMGKEWSNGSLGLGVGS